MEVKYREQNMEFFRFIMVGNCFKYCDDLYIKIRSFSVDCNSFNVTKCTVETIYKDTKVTPINMVLVEE